MGLEQRSLDEDLLVAEIRKLHATGIWEARVGLGLRMVFTLEANQLTLVRVGSHDEIRRYLRQL